LIENKIIGQQTKTAKTMVLTKKEALQLEGEMIKGSTKYEIRGVIFQWKRIPQLQSQKAREQWAKDRISEWIEAGGIEGIVEGGR
jgi:hypothetical protein